MQKGLLRTLLATALLASPLLGQGLPTAQPQDVGLSAERLDRIRTVFQKDVDEGKLVGATVLVARHGKTAYFKCLGALDRETGTPMTTDAIFRLASMSKPITSTAVMILAEEGRFLLDDPVSLYIPELKDRQVATVGEDGEVTTEPARSEITIRELLSHTSGLTYGFFGEGPVEERYRDPKIWQGTLHEFVAKIGELPLVHQPGTAWEYGVSADVLGYLVQVVSGMPFEDFLAQRLFAPLGMKDAGFYVPKEKLGRLATYYALGDAGLRPAAPAIPAETPPALPSGGGGLLSTTSDYARFLQMLLNGGALDGTRILSRKSVELMTSDHIVGLPASRILGDKRGFGLGFAIRRTLGSSGLPGSVGNYSWAGIYNTFFWVDPQEELFAVFMTQVTPYGYQNWGQRFQELVYSAIDD